MGHALVRRHSEDTYAGNCPYHGDCLEGIATGPAVEGRSGKKGHLLEEDHKTWELEAYYLAQATVQYDFIISARSDHLRWRRHETTPFDAESS